MSQAISAMSVSATSELSPDEIHSKLESLLHENLQLKGKLRIFTIDSWIKMIYFYRNVTSK